MFLMLVFSAHCFSVFTVSCLITLQPCAYYQLTIIECTKSKQHRQWVFWRTVRAAREQEQEMTTKLEDLYHQRMNLTKTISLHCNNDRPHINYQPHTQTTITHLISKIKG